MAAHLEIIVPGSQAAPWSGHVTKFQTGGPGWKCWVQVLSHSFDKERLALPLGWNADVGMKRRTTKQKEAGWLYEAAPPTCLVLPPTPGLFLGEKPSWLSLRFFQCLCGSTLACTLPNARDFLLPQLCAESPEAILAYTNLKSRRGKKS